MTAGFVMMGLLVVAAVASLVISVWFVLGRWEVGMDIPVAQADLMAARNRREQRAELRARLGALEHIAPNSAVPQ
ncbi:MAG: hypothetical protein LBR27_08835 [Bifidobacteriaceae bacterium]|jgi:hypothetical protein|nr:hypothetical protein [Bifidobacteriaceae bacterium]